MKRWFTITILVATIAMATLACELSGVLVDNNIGKAETGSGNTVEETRPVSGVTRVELATFGTVIIDIGQNESLRIEAEDNLLKYFDTAVQAGTLRIKTSPSNLNLRPTKPVYYFLTVKSLKQVSIAGSGDIQVPDLETTDFGIEIGGSGDVSLADLTADWFEIDIGGSGDVTTERVDVSKFRVRINGSGDITLGELNADELTLNVNGSGNLRIEDGKVVDQNIDINGSGNFQAENLASKNANILIGGSGDITLWVSEVLDVEVHGSGNVRYYGKPTVSSSGNGSGDITSLGDK